jgi:energy-coupling factor transporter ATP-binding protein EcfA2
MSAVEQSETLAKALSQAGATAGWSAASKLLPRRPYPGLRPFEKAEWPIFRGRDRLVQDILTILARNHFASIIGPSGSGKSSLVKAGVLATLERRHGLMGVQWRTAEMRPGVAPLWSMADGILRALRPKLVKDGELPEAEVARIRALIDISEDGLAVIMREFELEESENFLLLVDQFEEIFRYRSEEEDAERARLIELLLAVADDKPSGLYVVTTMRSEYLGDCPRFTGLAETLNETHYLVPRMNEEELRQAIVEPAEIKQGSIQHELVERLIEDVRSQKDQLPILQHTLLWMWIQEEEKRQSEGLNAGAGIHLGLAQYEQLEAGRSAGSPERVRNALSRHGDRILDGLSAEEQKVAEVMFRRMVEVEEHSNRLRRPTRAGTVAGLAKVSLDVVQRVVDAFRAADASFIRANRERVTENTSIDIMHESLIRQWDTLDRWVRQEKAAYEVYSELCRAAQRMHEGHGSLLRGHELSQALRWASQEQRTRLWARRYGGDLDAAMKFLMESEETDEQLRRREEEQLRVENERLRQLAKARRRFTQLAAAAAAVALILATLAGIGFLQARVAVIETQASSFWSRLELSRDPLGPEDVGTLWDLAGADDEVRVAFVRQMADDPRLLRQFGRNPQPIARAVGLRWPQEAREIARQSAEYVASEQFDPKHTDPFELIAYTGALAPLQQWLGPAVTQAVRANIAETINDLAQKEELTDTWLEALAETVGVFGMYFDPAAIEPAWERLRREIGATSAPNRVQRITRAIEVMARTLTPEERLQTVRTLAPLLGQDIYSPWAKAIPRALLALVPMLDAGQAEAVWSAVPPAIARAATNDRDSSYLLALMRLAEALGDAEDEKITESFGQALTAQLAQPNEPPQRTALVRAAVPLLSRRNDSARILASIVAQDVLVLDQVGAGSDPAHNAILRRQVLRNAEYALRRASSTLDGAHRERHSKEVWRIIHEDWSTKLAPDVRANYYRRAAQVRLLEALASSLPPEAVALARTDLLSMLPHTEDYLAREAIARGLAALAPRFSDPERHEALSAAKIALAKTGSTDEAIAWARATAALLPAEPHAATAEIVEMLKYPTAVDAPSHILLSALMTAWPKEYEPTPGRMLPDQNLVDWLEDHLPADDRLTTGSPPRPPSLEPIDAGLLPRS